MKDINIRCDNTTEAIYIEKYFLNNGYRWYMNHFNIKSLIEDAYPIIIYYREYSNNNIIYWALDSIIDSNLNRIEAKQLMRKEKLKRINK